MRNIKTLPLATTEYASTNSSTLPVHYFRHLILWHPHKWTRKFIEFNMKVAVQSPGTVQSPGKVHAPGDRVISALFMYLCPLLVNIY